ncbi:MAG: hypothetical protein KAJ19_28865 [Gammaproteobacteria bacterium]|nr:hypothetical protein [Gammaproteobacteria bacterium]
MKTPAQRLKKFYWWISERHRIYLNKEAGKEWPWTSDEIMQTYKFTNVFRELDAETIKFHERIDDLDLMPADKLYHMILFRAFNRAATYDMLTRGKRTHYTPAKMKRILHRNADRGKKIFTGAYIITNAGRSESKIDLMCEAMGVHWRGRRKIHEEMMADGTMQGCTKILRAYPMQGPFTAYEVICDMRHQKGMLDKAPDRRMWANLGPGARRGINRIVSSKKKPNVFHTTEEYIVFMREMLKTSPKHRGKHVPPLEMREIEHSLCEFDKWLRVHNNEGRPRSLYRRP